MTKNWRKSNQYRMLMECPFYIDEDYPMSGIYKITNKINGKVYIGQSVDVCERWRSHKRKLKNNKHNNSHLQNAYNKYGEDELIFECIELTDVENLTMRENYWMIQYNSTDREYGYNITKPSENLESYKWSEETKEKFSKARMQYTEDELLDALREYYNKHGKVPTTKNLVERDGLPSSTAYTLRFGSFKKALLLSGLFDKVENKNVFEKKKYDKEEILSDIKSFILINKRFPKKNDFNESAKNKIPSRDTIERLFGSVDNLKIELGLPTVSEVKELEKRESLISLRKLYETEGVINTKLIDSSNKTKSSSYYRKNFGNLEKACELADIPYTRNYK